jgi:F-type H+-transporting ATPase subunit b
MEEILQSLGDLLLKALPTFLLLIVFHLYLKWAFYSPLDKLLKKRSDATQGAKDAADASLARAAEKAEAYETAIREARTEIYREQDEMRRKREQERAEAIDAARQEADEALRKARAELAEQTEAARASLRAESEALAGEITEAVLEGRSN